MAALLGKDGRPILAFKTPTAWGTWLKKHYAASDGIWLKFAKKGSGLQSVTYAEALDEALCWGWIDSQALSLDEKQYLQRFGPRRSRSIWSKINRNHVARLIQEKRMRPSGLKEIEQAKTDGRWDAAYDSPKMTVPPPDFLHALEKNKRAKAFYGSLNRTNTYAIIWRINQAKKPETRAHRIAQFVQMFSEGKKLH